MTRPISETRPWVKSYPTWISPEINPDHYPNIPALIEELCQSFRDRPAFTNLGHSLTYGEIDEASRVFADYLTRVCGLKPGDRLAIQLPNILQYPIALYGAIRAGIVIVNTNPLYTEREMKHQFADSGAVAIVALANFADKLEHVLPETKIRHVIITEIGDCLPAPKRWIVNAVLRYVRKMVPPYQIRHTTFRAALAAGDARQFKAPRLTGSATAFLQYTGGTTGVSKGAVLTHRNILANMEQISAWITSTLSPGQETILTPLPLYHIFSLSVNCLAFARIGANMVLVTNPRDLPALVKDLRKYQPSAITLVNTLASALTSNAKFAALDFSRLKITVAGGMALQTAVAKKWADVTKTRIIEGYGLTETSPVSAVNPTDGSGKIGTIGLPVPSTIMKVIDEEGAELGFDAPGELCVQGPQVMQGYWNQPAETRQVLSADGWLRTGDIAQIDTDGYFKIVDRKKDMILVSGFNVYPNEVEDVATRHPKVREAAAVGVMDERCGETVKLFAVKSDPSLTEKELLAFCATMLTAYKVPRSVQFMDELPKNNVGKILRRELRAQKSKNNGRTLSS